MSAYQVNETNGHEWLSVVAGASRFNVASKGVSALRNRVDAS